MGTGGSQAGPGVRTRPVKPNKQTMVDGGDSKRLAWGTRTYCIITECQTVQEWRGGTPVWGPGLAASRPFHPSRNAKSRHPISRKSGFGFKLQNNAQNKEHQLFVQVIHQKVRTSRSYFCCRFILLISLSVLPIKFPFGASARKFPDEDVLYSHCW